MRDLSTARPADYPSEYATWKMMMQRRKKGLCRVHRHFLSFPQFLAYVGPKQHPSDTLDRINSSDDEYAPNKVRWASKSLQSRNRKNTVWLKYTGSKYPEHREKKLSLTEWATLTQQNPSTMRRRRSEGWSANENIDGQRARQPKRLSEMSLQELWDYRPWDVGKEAVQEDAFLLNRRDGESRASFKRRFVPQVRLNVLCERNKEIAYYLPSEHDAYEDEWGDFSRVVGDWGRRRGASQKAFKRLVADYEKLQAQKKVFQREEREWLAAYDKAKVKSDLERRALAVRAEPKTGPARRRANDDVDFGLDDD